MSNIIILLWNLHNQSNYIVRLIGSWYPDSCMGQTVFAKYVHMLVTYVVSVILNLYQPTCPLSALQFLCYCSQSNANNTLFNF